MPELAIIIPTRGRPENIRKVIEAWDFTNAWDHADMILVADADDPEIQGYRNVVESTEHPDTGDALVQLVEMDQWRPMVHKLNEVASLYSQIKAYFALGFAGDDHLPRTIGWAQAYLSNLHELGTGMVYGDDGYQGAKLSTEWAVTADAVRVVGRMVPADVEHMYCDNSMMDLYGGAGALRFLPQIRIEHMHPVAGKAERDEQYDRVNHRDQFNKDRRAYESWRHGDVFRTDVAEVRHLRKGRPDEQPGSQVHRRLAGSAGQHRRVTAGSQARRVTASRSPFPRHFRNVIGVTPEEIGIALADFAARVPADQEIVELGVYHGRTALQMAWGARQGHGAHLTAIDPWDLPGNVYGDEMGHLGEARAWARYHVQAHGYANRITLVQEFSAIAATSWAGKPVGMLYVDGDHTEEAARRDIESWTPHFAPEAVIAVDDYGNENYPGVRRAIDALVSEGVLAPVVVYHDRLAVTRLMGRSASGDPGQPSRVTAITSEGVGTSPTVPGQVAAEQDSAELLTIPPDIEVSALTWDVVAEGELEGVPAGTEVPGMNLVQLKALAKARGIVLGARKDLRMSILQALRDGK